MENMEEQNEVRSHMPPAGKSLARAPFASVSLARRLATRIQEQQEDERGAVTAEYAVVIMGAVAFAGVLVAIMRSGEIRSVLLDLVQQALGGV